MSPRFELEKTKVNVLVAEQMPTHGGGGIATDIYLTKSAMQRAMSGDLSRHYLFE